MNIQICTCSKPNLEILVFDPGTDPAGSLAKLVVFICVDNSYYMDPDKAKHMCWTPSQKPFESGTEIYQGLASANWCKGPRVKLLSTLTDEELDELEDEILCRVLAEGDEIE